MEWSRIVAALVAATALVASGARAQDAETQQVQQTDVQPAKGDASSGTTVDADGVPVPKPNPMSRFMKEDRSYQDIPIEQPLVDDYRNNPSPDNQTK